MEALNLKREYLAPIFRKTSLPSLAALYCDSEIFERCTHLNSARNVYEWSFFKLGAQPVSPPLYAPPMCIWTAGWSLNILIPGHQRVDSPSFLKQSTSE